MQDITCCLYEIRRLIIAFPTFFQYKCYRVFSSMGCPNEEHQLALQSALVPQARRTCHFQMAVSKQTSLQLSMLLLGNVSFYIVFFFLVVYECIILFKNSFRMIKRISICFNFTRCIAKQLNRLSQHFSNCRVGTRNPIKASAKLDQHIPCEKEIRTRSGLH